jgi:hypothetical protein
MSLDIGLLLRDVTAFSSHGHADQDTIAEARRIIEPLIREYVPDCLDTPDSKAVIDELATRAADYCMAYRKGLTPEAHRQLFNRLADTKALDDIKKKVFEIEQALDSLNWYQRGKLEDHLGEPHALSHIHRVHKPPGIAQALERLALAAKYAAEDARKLASTNNDLPNPETNFALMLWPVLQRQGIARKRAAKVIARAAIALNLTRNRPELAESIRVMLSKSESRNNTPK